MEINKGKDLDKDKDKEKEKDKDKDKDKDLDEYSEDSKNSSIKNNQNDKLKKKILPIKEKDKDGEFIKRSRIVHKGSLKKLNIGNSRKINGVANFIKINEKKSNKNDNLKENDLIKGIIFF